MRISVEQFDTLTQLINYHIRIHSGFELHDAYKLIHQSVFGPEHLGEGILADSIAGEMDTAGIESGESLLEPVSVDMGACRMNLRAAKRLEVVPAIIADAVRTSAGKFSRDPGEMSQLWHEVGDSLDDISGGFSRDDYEALTRLVQEKDYPPLHHSPSYRDRNRPAYRVVLRGEVELLMPDLPASDLWR